MKANNRLNTETENGDQQDVITFYDQSMPWFELSNFYRHSFDLDGECWPTVEHYYQATKFSDEDYRTKIRNAANPREAKRLGRNNPDIYTDWEEWKEAVMYKALLAKFSNSILAEKLISTGTNMIVESSPEDSYWGAGRDGKGQNRLGEILMHVRDDIVMKKQTKHTQWIAQSDLSPNELADKMGDLYYDALADYLRLLAAKIEQDGAKDRDRGRVKLATSLKAASDHLQKAADEIDTAWEICKPYLD